MNVQSEKNERKDERMKNHLKGLKKVALAILGLMLAAGCDQPQNRVDPPGVGLLDATAQGDLQAVNQHIAAGSDLEERDPVAGSTALISASAFGHVEVVRALIEGGADVNAKNNDGSTPLHTAAFLCHPQIVEALLANGADKRIRNNFGATALDAVVVPFEEVKPVYDLLAASLGPFGLQVDYERIKTTRPQIAEMLR